MHAPTTWLKQANMFYSSFIQPDVLSQIMELVSDSEAPLAFNTICSLLDYAVLNTLCQSLDQASLLDVLKMAATRYNDESLLEQIGEHSPELITRIQQTVERRLLAVHSAVKAQL